MEQIKTKIENGDCLEVLKRYPDNFFNLIVTSPPYAVGREMAYPTNVLHFATKCNGAHTNLYRKQTLNKG
jgi:DNA modification methylase